MGNDQPAMKFKIGDPIVWAPYCDRPEISAGTVTRVSAGYVWVDNNHKPEDCIDRVYCYPAKYLEALIEVLKRRQELKKLYDDSLSQLFHLRHRVIREQEDEGN